jgi:hypothetical protein
VARRELCLRKNVVQPWDQDEPATNADEPAQKACSGAKAKEEEHIEKVEVHGKNDA